MTMQPLEILALVASVVMPFWNIPLIHRIIQRKSSGDMSIAWLWGVWLCMLLMVPWAIVTTEMVLKVFSLVNFMLFSCVVVVVLKYRQGEKECPSN
ncbi:MAG: hypothetical protein WCI27_04365 [Candidatus Omnitrophota bacterium]